MYIKLSWTLGVFSLHITHPKHKLSKIKRLIKLTCELELTG